jgi:hypothetical protein
MKAGRIKICGTPLVKEGPSPAQEVLEEQGEIFSCGGVYLGLHHAPRILDDALEVVFLPNHRREILILNGENTSRISSEGGQELASSPQDRPSTGTTLRRFFKESLN